MAWAFPNLFQWIQALLFASLAFLVAGYLEHKKGGRVLEGLIFFGIAFTTGLGFLPVLVFPVLSLIVPLLLLVQVASKNKTARIVALVGLLPLLSVFALGRWDAYRAGPYYRLDSFSIPEHMVGQLRGLDTSDLSDELLLDSLFSRDDIRRHNALVLLLARSGDTDDATLKQWRAGLEQRLTEDELDEAAVGLINRLDEVLKSREGNAQTSAEPGAGTKQSASDPATASP